MSDEIKPGDLVMVVKPMPCCGKSDITGMIFGVTNRKPAYFGTCLHCLDEFEQSNEWVILNSGYSVNKNRLKKINPPSEGDSLPARADKEITA